MPFPIPTFLALFLRKNPFQNALRVTKHAPEQVLATNGVGPFPYYRIVALASLGNGVVLASYDGRPDGGDSPSPNSILQRRSTDSGATWGAPTYIAKGQPGATGVQQYGFSDPSYVVDKDTGKVFNFHVFSKNTGFAASVIGNDDANLNVMSAEVSVSTDGGVSWSTDPTNQPNLPPAASSLITKVVKPVGQTVNGVANVGGVIGEFASSGEGIQLRYGAHAGRLIQQYAGRVIQPSGNVIIQAYSVYSDDGGSTWHMGNPVGVGMDENKVVELSNGNVMLNSRPSDSSGYRKVSISTDGGVTYSVPTSETQLPDPANNGAITRMYPDAAEGSTNAKILLFTNANSQTSRINGTVRYSCDDGKTWSGGRPFHSGAMSYSTITALSDGMFGIFYEGTGNTLTFAKVDKAYLGVSC
ncbi:hypothetical protein V495_04652 [Pseudogymnoascus sp. VKM F-4514 (FW-929)]|nr:hypothetical protein V490_04284 [Pseudogymnoascus sp. VKM F-3557]KFY42170.1 hypothetical protein V495_04652 [Pseudogymnoascus sp. VKM F-4514 (FW-929)]